MIAFALAFQMAAAQALVVRTPSETVRIPTVRTASGPMVNVESLARVMPIRVTRDSGAFYTVEVWGAKLQLEAGSTTLRVGADVRPLAVAPATKNGSLLIPLQLVSEVFPATIP